MFVQFTCDFCYLVNFETMLFCMTCSLEKSMKNQDFLGGRKLFVTECNLISRMNN